jgi:bifunctional enzyme CysN/CysC
MRIAVTGHVDHGKSTLIARLLHETGALPEGKVAELEAASRARGVPFEWSFALDALQDERDQAVTIDTTRAWFSWGGRRYTIIDAPGHREFVRNMLSGAAEADAAVLVVDAGEGIGEQTRRHAQILELLGIRDVIVAVNKMDAVEWRAERFQTVRDECAALLLACHLRVHACVPVAARDGDNLVTRSPRMPWYREKTLMEAVADLQPAEPPVKTPLRLRIQDVYREDESRVAVGRVDSGSVSAGDTVVISPSGSQTTVASIVRWNAPQRDTAEAGESIGLTFTDPVYITRGDVLSHESDRPALDYGFRAACFWLADEPPEPGEQLILQMGPTKARVLVAGIEAVIDSGTLEQLSTEQIPRYAIVEMRLRSSSLLALDEASTLRSAARLVLLRGHDVVAAGVVSHVLGLKSSAVAPAAHLITREERARRTGHRGAVVWLTGLSASGKSTLAMALERKLFNAGAAVYVLDGDNLRVGLNRDLGFSAGDRSENIRRIGEVAALFADAGHITIAAFISPMERDRELARRAAGSGFHEIYVRTDLATCEKRDPKGLYKRARAGEIAEFTGISAPYEAPSKPELILDTGDRDLESCVNELYAYVDRVTRPVPGE